MRNLFLTPKAVKTKKVHLTLLMTLQPCNPKTSGVSCECEGVARRAARARR